MDSQLVTDTAPAGDAASDSAVTRYYSGKTADILHKYGPGPRVHFHVGLFAAGAAANTTVAQHVIKSRIVAAQEAMLEHAAALWSVAASPPASMLDIGCGLGGGAIYWAQEHGASVTGLTNTAEHVPLVAGFARAAGVADRVRARLADVHELADRGRHDAAVAIESSGYMDRGRLFAVVARALRPGGWFGIEEHFLCRPEWAGYIDRYYRTRLGTLTEYITAARAAGFALELDEDVTDRVTEFWVQSMAWTAMELAGQAGRGAGPIGRERLTDSAIAHGTFFRIWREHAVQTRLLLFRLR